MRPPVRLVAPGVGLVGLLYLVAFSLLFLRSANRDDMVGALAAMVSSVLAVIPALGLVPREVGKPPAWLAVVVVALVLLSLVLGSLTGLVVVLTAVPLAYRLAHAGPRTLTAWRLVATAVCALLVVPLLLLLAPGLLLRT